MDRNDLEAQLSKGITNSNTYTLNIIIVGAAYQQAARLIGESLSREGLSVPHYAPYIPYGNYINTCTYHLRKSLLKLIKSRIPYCESFIHSSYGNLVFNHIENTPSVARYLNYVNMLFEREGMGIKMLHSGSSIILSLTPGFHESLPYLLNVDKLIRVLETLHRKIDFNGSE